MKTALDSCIVLDVLTADPVHGAASARLLQYCVSAGQVVVSDIAWAELSAAFGTIESLKNTADRLRFSFDALNAESAWQAGQLHSVYRRRGGNKSRVVADFLIGAHAWLQCDALATRDSGFYRDYFAGLTIISTVPAT